MRSFASDREKHKYYNSLTAEQKYEAFCDILFESESTVFLGGAGVSTESGIPDFRSRNGLYRKRPKGFLRYKPEYLLSSECLQKKPELFFDYYRKNLDARSALPNGAHLALAQLELSGRLTGVITQNIDGLHQKAGSRNVQEIHGTIRTNHCTSCRAVYGENFIFDSREPVPHCPVCGRTVRPDVTLYGEFLPQPAYTNAIDLIGRADTLIIGGTSLEVGSAAQLAHMFHGRHMVIVNKGKTKMEGAADLVFHDSISKVLEKIV
ncbi:MAG: NAD-dependent protein deacylase [Lachnospiraceae bacterium]|nr:NAD-dependent protein deacylase [Lachnospiraceae bacterium]